jgi:hypothetical protein
MDPLFPWAMYSRISRPAFEFPPVAFAKLQPAASTKLSSTANAFPALFVR